MVSNVAHKSKSARAVGSPCASERWTSIFIANKAISVECPGL